jgi:hypothetical protein
MATNERPAKAVADLAPFIGTWDTSGTVLDADGKAAGELKATDIYEWFPGEFFVLHHVEGTLGDAEVRALEVIGVGEGDGCVARSYDNAGQSDEYAVALRGRSWTIDGSTQRFRGSFSEDFTTLEGSWEASDDGKTWRWWMNITLRKR